MDDLLLFSRRDSGSVEILLGCFNKFSKASGLQANTDKSAIYFGGVAREEQEAILSKIGFVKGNLPFKYLGVPLSSRKLTISQYQPLIDKMIGKIGSWTA